MVRSLMFSSSELTRWELSWPTELAWWQLILCAGPSAEDRQHWGEGGGREGSHPASHHRGAPGPALRPASPGPEGVGAERGDQQESPGDFLLAAPLAASPEVRPGRLLLRLSGPAGSLLWLGRGVFLLCLPHKLQLSLRLRVLTERLRRPSQAVRGQSVSPHRGVQGEAQRPGSTVTCDMWPVTCDLYFPTITLTSCCRRSAVAPCLSCLNLPRPTLERTCRAWIPPSASHITRRADTARRSSPWPWPPPVSAPSYSASWPASSWLESASVDQTTRITCLTSTGQLFVTKYGEKIWYSGLVLHYLLS